MAFVDSKQTNNSRFFIAEERKYILGKETDFSISEAYNVLRSNIMFSVIGERCKVISVSSTLPSEGKSINALNVAISFADIGKRVLIIDCDLRKPKLHNLLNIEASPGFSNIIVGDCDIDSAIRRIPELRIDVICSGDIPPVSTRLLESEEVDDFFYYVKRNYDYIFLDTPPIDVVIDSCVLAKHTNGTVFVIRENYAKKEKIINAVKQLEFAGGKVLGYVLNRTVNKKAIHLFGNDYRTEYRYLYEDEKSENKKDKRIKKMKSAKAGKKLPGKNKTDKSKSEKDNRKLFKRTVVKKVPKGEVKQED